MTALHVPPARSKSDYGSVFFLLTVLLSGLSLTSCSAEKEPEQIAETFIAGFEETIEKRDVRSIRPYIAEHYRDEKGRSRQDIVATAAGYILRNKSIHIYSKLDSAIQEGATIEVRVLAAVAGRPIDDLALLPSLDADMYWVEFSLDTGTGEPLMTQASWRQAMLDDFLAE
jgi:hypothetical protein